MMNEQSTLVKDSIFSPSQDGLNRINSAMGKPLPENFILALKSLEKGDVEIDLYTSYTFDSFRLLYGAFGGDAGNFSDFHHLTDFSKRGFPLIMRFKNLKCSNDSGSVHFRRDCYALYFVRYNPDLNAIQFLSSKPYVARSEGTKLEIMMGDVHSHPNKHGNRFGVFISTCVGNGPLSQIPLRISESSTQKHMKNFLMTYIIETKAFLEWEVFQDGYRNNSEMSCYSARFSRIAVDVEVEDILKKIDPQEMKKYLSINKSFKLSKLPGFSEYLCKFTKSKFLYSREGILLQYFAEKIKSAERQIVKELPYFEKGREFIVFKDQVVKLKVIEENDYMDNNPYHICHPEVSNRVLSILQRKIYKQLVKGKKNEKITIKENS